MACFPPTPVYCDGAFAADSLRVHQIPSCGGVPLEIPNLNFRSLTQSQSSPKRHEFDSRAASTKLFLARAKCVQAEPMESVTI
jgi:hypothetical protein